MVFIINKFHNLHPPTSDSGGARNNDWVCHDNDNQYTYYLLNKDRYMIADLMKQLRQHDFYFDTEYECHIAAWQYYQSYGQMYPYLKEMSACAPAAVVPVKMKVLKSRDGGGHVIINGGRIKDIDESQVMEFI